jgi:hypothetical protein
MTVTMSALAADPSPWKFGWEALVAIGTLVLAAATGGLAWSTRSLAKKTAEEVRHSGQLVEASQRQTKAAQEQARAAQDALAETREQTRISQLTLKAQIRPVLIDVPLDLAIEEPIFYPGRDEAVTGHRGAVHVGGSDDELLVSVPVRNAGVGLAMIRGISLEIGTAIGPPAVMIVPANVAPRERARVSFRATPGDAAFAPVREVIQRNQTMSVVVSYTDLAGQQMTLSRFDLYFRSRAHWNWEVRQVHFQEPGADAPYAGSAPVA